MITTVTPENADAYGRFSVVTRALADGSDTDPASGTPYPVSTVMSVHRAPLAPGHWEGTTWVATDVSDQPANIQAFATALWTAPVVAAFKAAFPAESLV
jgi:hypothetical protein